VVAGVDAQPSGRVEGVLFVSHSLLGVVGHNVFKHLSLGQQVAIVIVPEKPEPGGLVVKVVVYTEVVFAALLDTSFFNFLHHLNYNISSSKDIGLTSILSLHHII